MAENMIKIYTRTDCRPCKQTKVLMTRFGIDFEEVNIDQDKAAMEYLRTLGVKTAPFIETEDDSWVGFRPDNIRKLVGNGN